MVEALGVEPGVHGPPPGDPAAVRRRHVFYIPGYDPRSPRTYFLLFRRELRKWATLSGVTAELARSPGDEGETAWRLRAEGASGEVSARFDFLRWDDLVAREFALSPARRLLTSVAVLADALWSGWAASMARWSWKFGLFAAYPWVMAALYSAVGLGLAAAGYGAWLLAGGSAAAGVVAVVGTAACLYAWARLTVRWEPKLYVWYLVNDWIFTWRHRRGVDAAARERFERFAGRVAAAAESGEADEVLLIGHSTGSVVAVEVAARVLELAPTLGGHGRPLALLTIGANTVIAAGGRRETSTRRAVAALVCDTRVRWIEYFAPQDVMNFAKLDHRRVNRIDLAGRVQVNPVVRSARFKEIFSEATYRRVLWRFFDLHFQFLRANDVPGEYDLYRMLAGPERFGTSVDRAG